MPLLELKNLTQHFGQRIAVNALNLSVEKGEVLSLLGPSGCGKTTTIRLIAGFLTPTRGSILVNGKDVVRLPPERRKIGMVFQSYALFPHLDVYENVAFGLRAARFSREQIDDRVRQSLKLVNLAGYERRPIFELSGGEQQRVAIARAVVIEPQILLLDEPLSNLDAGLRERTRNQLRELITTLGITTIFVTHDQEEAFALSDRIALLLEGKCEQVGTPQELYDRPVNEFVASFIGKSNILSLTLKAIGEDCLIFSLPSGSELRLRPPTDRELQEGNVCRLLLRPDRIEFANTPGNIKLFPAKILNKRFAGAVTEWELEGEGYRLLALQSNRGILSSLKVGMIVDIFASPGAFHIF